MFSPIVPGRRLRRTVAAGVIMLGLVAMAGCATATGQGEIRMKRVTPAQPARLVLEATMQERAALLRGERVLTLTVHAYQPHPSGGALLLSLRCGAEKGLSLHPIGIHPARPFHDGEPDRAQRFAVSLPGSMVPAGDMLCVEVAFRNHSPTPDAVGPVPFALVSLGLAPVR